MAELLLRVLDKSDPNNPDADACMSKAGDVIAICPDDWSWSAEEMNSDQWRVVKLPGLAESAVADLLDTDDSGPNGFCVRKRARYLDLSSGAIRNRIGPPGTVITVSVAQRAAFVNAKRTKPPIGGAIG